MKLNDKAKLKLARATIRRLKAEKEELESLASDLRLDLRTERNNNYLLETGHRRV
jgi:hypothetical protein